MKDIANFLSSSGILRGLINSELKKIPTAARTIPAPVAAKREEKTAWVNPVLFPEVYNRETTETVPTVRAFAMTIKMK
jgi:hypothetical protein